MTDFPTEFRGCTWDEHWEFDAPVVVYYPFKYYSPNGGNSGHIDKLVEDLCIDIALGKTPAKDFTEFDLKEFKWRRWGTRFERRKCARHVVIHVKWSKDKHGEDTFEFIRRYETSGPPNKRVQPTASAAKSKSRSKRGG